MSYQTPVFEKESAVASADAEQTLALSVLKVGCSGITLGNILHSE